MLPGGETGWREFTVSPDGSQIYGLTKRGAVVIMANEKGKPAVPFVSSLFVRIAVDTTNRRLLALCADGSLLNRALPGFESGQQSLDHVVGPRSRKRLTSNWRWRGTRIADATAPDAHDGPGCGLYPLGPCRQLQQLLLAPSNNTVDPFAKFESSRLLVVVGPGSQQANANGGLSESGADFKVDLVGASWLHPVPATVFDCSTVGTCLALAGPMVLRSLSFTGGTGAVIVRPTVSVSLYG